MGEVLGLGLSHFPGFLYADADMAMRVKQIVQSERVPAALKEPAGWPAPMQAEWGADEGAAFAAAHRAQFSDRLPGTDIRLSKVVEGEIGAHRTHISSELAGRIDAAWRHYITRSLRQRILTGSGTMRTREEDLAAVDQHAPSRQ